MNRNARDYGVVTLAYWAFTITDGALRMLVLLHFHKLGWSPFDIASLFLFYEFFGIVTNLAGGWIGSRTGLKLTLFCGLALQIAACSVLYFNSAQLTLLLVMVTQGMSGVAKDLTKMSSKSYVRLVVPDDDRKGLMKWVSVLTGSKNALKGAGFFVGGFLLATVEFKGALMVMLALLAIALITSAILLPGAAGKSKSKTDLKKLVSKDARLNWLSAARLFLFGSRDIWFVVALPVFLSAHQGWTFTEVGAFLALWIIGYGVVQALAPVWVSAKKPPDASRLLVWTWVLVLPLLGLGFALHRQIDANWTLIVGLSIFGVIFAANSAIHSFLVVAYSNRDQVALDVGFYYMANAAGRLFGTVLSGAIFQTMGMGTTGLVACLLASVAFVAVSGLLCIPLQSAERAALRSE